MDVDKDMDVDEDGIDDIVIVVKGNIYLISGARGVLLWQQELSENFQVQLIKVTSETSQYEKKLILVGSNVISTSASFFDFLVTTLLLTSNYQYDNL